MTGHNLFLETAIQPEYGEAARGFFTDLLARLHNDIETCFEGYRAKMPAISCSPGSC